MDTTLAPSRAPLPAAFPSYSDSGAETLLLAELKPVSRSFYKTLRVLPAEIRRPIGLAYLLARMTDTVADTEIVPVAERIATLTALRECIQNGTSVDLSHFAPHASSAEERLLARSRLALQWLAECPARDRALIREVLSTITKGQELDLQRFPRQTPKTIIALETDADLDDYTYRVAGCVGQFWTRLAWQHLLGQEPQPSTIADGIRLGKGLQLVNILRDVPQDLDRGRCYLPRTALAAVQLLPEDLLRPENEGRFRPIYDRYLGIAEGHLRQGWLYTLAIPWAQVRLRLACAWPVLIGIETLRRLHNTEVLGTTQPIKIRRADVRQLVYKSLILYPFRGLWRRLPGADW